MENKKNILIVDDDANFCKYLSKFLQKNYNIFTAGNKKELYKIINDEYIDLVFLDVDLPDTNGIDEIERIKKNLPNVILIMITAFNEINFAIKSIKIGADDYLVKPIDLDEITIVIEKHFKEQEIKFELDNLKNLATRGKTEFIGRHPKIRALKSLLLKTSRSPINSVLISGDSGTGKELAARFIHMNGSRAAGPFVVVNCPSIPDNLFESELFGFRKGAFTSATYSKKGLIELANKGTLFFDEISEISLNLQAKLLRFIENRTINPIGSNKEIFIDVRVLIATNKNLEDELEKGTFREDLYYRINVMHIYISPLRERQSDILLLSNYYLKHFNSALNKNIKDFSKSAVSMLNKYHWPGNVRELRNVIERAVILCEDKSITSNEIDINFNKQDKPLQDELDILTAEENLNIQLINKALKSSDMNITKAAKLLNLGRTALRHRINKYKIPVKISQ